MMKKYLAGALAAAVTIFSVGAASAASLAVVGGTDYNLNNNYDLTAETGLAVGTGVKIFNPFVGSTDGSNGLQITGAPTTIRITYLGSESGALNRTFYSGTNPATFVFDTNSAEGTYADFTVGADGAVPFYFENENGTGVRCKFIIFGCSIVELEDDQANNDGGIDWQLTLGLYEDTDGSVIALLGDSFAFDDLDDMAIRISVVPLPPALLMFGAALLGLGWIKRRKQVA